MMFDTYCTMNLQTFWALTIKITIHQVSVYVDLVYLPPFKGPRRTPTKRLRCSLLQRADQRLPRRFCVAQRAAAVLQHGSCARGAGRHSGGVDAGNRPGTGWAWKIGKNGELCGVIVVTGAGVRSLL